MHGLRQKAPETHRKCSCIGLRYSLGLFRTFTLARTTFGRVEGPAITSLDAKPEHTRGGVRVHIDQMRGVRALQLTVPELQLSSRSLVSAMPALDMPALDMPAANLTRGMPHAHLRRQTTKLISWRGRGEVCPQPTTTAVQGGRIAGYGAYDVTDSKFSTKWRPPSCSPPV